jgi:hypothetical protein
MQPNPKRVDVAPPSTESDLPVADTASSAFGVLHKYARPYTEKDLEAATLKYFADRHRQKLADALRDARKR